jgi:uncharacterized protein (DUF1697 family)
MMHVALLRGINVGSARKVAMADLRVMAEDAGFAEVRTLLASGNLVLESGALTGAALEAALEREAKARLGLETHVIVRSAREWEALIAGNPLLEPAETAPSRFMVLVMRDPVSTATVQALEQLAVNGEQVRVGERCLYAAFPSGVSTSKLGQAIAGSKLGPATARNWNTVKKLAVMMG